MRGEIAVHGRMKLAAFVTKSYTSKLVSGT